jgi:ABC-2 type transport system permease protein
VDHIIWIYRDLSSMARMPIDIYAEAIRALLTYVVPVALIFTFPAQGILGLVQSRTVAVILGASLLIYWLSLRLWNFALTRYSSASS